MHNDRKDRFYAHYTRAGIVQQPGYGRSAVMQSLKATHISPTEWRWVFVVGGVLTALTLLPYAWALAGMAASDQWQFMGLLANPQDGATYLAKIEQGIRGAWLFHLVHTPEPHAGAAINLFYLLLGHFARLIGLSSLEIFHLARVATTLFMYSALYVFGATVWPRLRPRRLFFVLVAVGSGLGWLLLVFGVRAGDIPDLTVPEAYPLYAAYTNPHFPLAIGCLALLATTYVDAFRVDFKDPPSAINGGLGVSLLTLVLVFVLPQALLPLGSTLVVYLAVRAVRSRALPVRELRWVMVFVLPIIPAGVYYLLLLQYNWAMQSWNGQIATFNTSPLLVIMGYGLLLATAVPGLVRAIRRFEADGDQLMLIWLGVNFVLAFLPFNHQRRMLIGLIIPVVFFAVRSVEDYWLRVIPERLRMPALIGLIVLVMPSTILAMGIPLFGIMNPEVGRDEVLLVERGYWDAMQWLNQNGKPDDVVLSSPNIGLWIPAWGNKRVVYGHPYETLSAATKLAQVEAWYRGDCGDLLEQYHVRYVIVGPQERALGNGEANSDACYAPLEDRSVRHVQFEDVTLYELAD